VKMFLITSSAAVQKPRDLESRLCETWNDLVDAKGTMNGFGTSLSPVVDLL
jgi:hypothetical protein